MYCRKRIPVAGLSVLFCLITSASAKEHPRIAPQSTPAVEVFVYGFPGLSRSIIEEAEAEADRILRPVPIRLDWINCISRQVTSSCLSPQLPMDLTVQIRPKAFPEVGTSALGSTDPGAAFLFYDRIVALRNERRMLFPMLGRVLAHEMTHLLLPNEAHSESGLMRAQWSTNDLTLTSIACLGLSARSIELMYREALRRVRTKDEVVGNNVNSTVK